MQSQMYEYMFEGEEQEFTDEEIVTYKRYIEENNVYSENNFEFLEENLSYYASRYTRDSYLSPFELFQVNSDFSDTDEMRRNMGYYHSSVEWYGKTVHPEDSECVIKEEKYIYTDSLNETIRELIGELNRYPAEGYQCMDLLICYKNNIYKYLPRKNFVFTWRKSCESLMEYLVKAEEKNFPGKEKPGLEAADSIIVLPVSVPIRKGLFLGEFGFRSAMVSYGKIVERVERFRQDLYKCEDMDTFDNSDLNHLLGLDGVEKSIYNILILRRKV